MKRQRRSRSLKMWPIPDRCRIMPSANDPDVGGESDLVRSIPHVCTNEHHLGAEGPVGAHAAKEMFKTINQKKAFALERQKRVGPVLCGDIHAADDDGWTLLFFAVRYGQVDTTRELLLAGSDCNKRDKHGNTPLHVAVMKGQVEITKLLLKQDGIDVDVLNCMGQTPFMLAVELGFKDFVHVLDEHGADINICDGDGRSPIYRAIERGLFEIADFLLDKHCDVTKDTASEHTCFYALSHSPHGKVSHCARRLLKLDYDFRLDADWLLREGCPITKEDDSCLHDKIMAHAGIIPEQHHHSLLHLGHGTRKLISHVINLSHHHHHHHQQEHHRHQQQVHDHNTPQEEEHLQDQHQDLQHHICHHHQHHHHQTQQQ